MQTSNTSQNIAKLKADMARDLSTIRNKETTRNSLKMGMQRTKDELTRTEQETKKLSDEITNLKRRHQDNVNQLQKDTMELQKEMTKSAHVPGSGLRKY